MKKNVYYYPSVLSAGLFALSCLCLSHGSSKENNKESIDTQLLNYIGNNNLTELVKLCDNDSELDLNKPINRDKETCLHYAAKKQDVKNSILSSLVSKGARQIPDGSKQLPLHLAGRYLGNAFQKIQKAKITYLLGKFKGQANAKDRNGNTVFHIILQCFDALFFEKIIELGVDPSIPNSRNKTMLELCKDALETERKALNEVKALMKDQKNGKERIQAIKRCVALFEKERKWQKSKRFLIRGGIGIFAYLLGGGVWHYFKSRNNN